MFTRIRHRLLELLRREQGAVLILAAIAAVMLVIVAGAAIDMARDQALQSKMQTALDAAALATGEVGYNEINTTGVLNHATLTATAQKYFTANFPTNYLFTTTCCTVTATPNPSSTAIVLSTSTTTPTTLMAISGNHSMTITTAATVTIAPPPATPVNGVCSNPVQPGQCASGYLEGIVNFGSTVSWSCLGLLGGTSTSCCGYTGPMDGVCGSAVDTCAIPLGPGTNFTPFPFSWQCPGLNGGNTVSCNLNTPVNGLCGTAFDTCNAGTPGVPVFTTWPCIGTNGGTTATCSTNYPVSGNCGSTAGTCNPGSASAVVNHGATTTWTCNGFNSICSSSCSAPTPINGACSTTVDYMCTAGVLDVASESNNGATTTWMCDGTNGGSNASCGIPDPINGACGGSQYTCTAGTLVLASESDNSVTSTWVCDGVNGGTNTVPPCTSPDACNMIALHCSTCHWSGGWSPAWEYTITYNNPNACSPFTALCDGVGCPNPVGSAPPPGCGCTGSPGF